MRRIYKGKPVTYVLTGRNSHAFAVDFHQGTVTPVPSVDDRNHPLQVHTAAHILRQSLSLEMIHMIGVSKRVRFRSRKSDARYFLLLEAIYTAYENGLFPLGTFLGARSFQVWIPRWRELLLYACILTRKALGVPFRMEDYLKPDKP